MTTRNKQTNDKKKRKKKPQILRNTNFLKKKTVRGDI